MGDDVDSLSAFKPSVGYTVSVLDFFLVCTWEKKNVTATVLSRKKKKIKDYTELLPTNTEGVLGKQHNH